MAKNFDLCTEQDSFLEDKPIWVATLSSGITVYQDDNRPEVDEPIAWKRLRSYCIKQKEQIEFLRIKFRSHVVPITPKKNLPTYYYFAYGITKDIVDDFNQEYYLSGFCLGDNLHYSWYKVPEILKEKTSTIDIPEDIDKDERFIPTLELTKDSDLL